MTGTDIRDLISPSYIRLGSGHTLREALGIAVVALESRGVFPPMVVLDEEGDVFGIVTPLALLQGLCGDDSDPNPSPGDIFEGEALEEDFLERAQGRLQTRILQVVIKPPLLLNARHSIVDAARKVAQSGLDFLPVTEGRRAIGVVHAADLFGWVASLALDEPLVES